VVEAVEVELHPHPEQMRQGEMAVQAVGLVIMELEAPVTLLHTLHRKEVMVGMALELH
jgi:hypothetical protein